MKIDFSALNQDLIRRCPDILVEWFPQGRLKGHEFVVGSTSGEAGKSLSVNINTGIWKDFATDEGGDLVQLYAYCKGCSNGQAADRLIEKYSIREAVEDEPLLPVPRGYHREAPISDASMAYEYLDANGELLIYMLRYERGAGKKSFSPLSYWRNSGWQKKMPPGKHSLYGLQILAKHPKSTVIIVEGEKSADAGAKLSSTGTGDYVFMTWPGGSSSYKQAKWNVLSGCDVILWPDADDPGIKAMNSLAEVLKTLKVVSIHILDVSGHTGGWDVADAASDGWSARQLVDWIVDNKRLIYPLPDEPEKENIHFRSLGYHGKNFMFYIQATGQVVAFKGTEFEMWGNLHTLAPAHYWERHYNNAKMELSGATMKRLISDALIRQSEANGYYDPSIIRGRGVWEDNGKSVLHLGNKLIVDGVECDIRTFKTDYIYEQRVTMHIRTRGPLESSEATKLLDICNLVRWEESISGFLLAGWIFSSIICGVLPWRSHIYLTGPVGSGKTWIVENIIKRCLRGLGVTMQGTESTEAGLRQIMKGDARPVLFDEAEADTRENAARMQRIFALARQASSEGAAPIVKGTQNQIAAIEYIFRSCFVFASIQPSMTHYADESRITLLRLGNPYGGEGGERFQKLLDARNRIITDDFCDGLISRAVRMAPIIRHNHRVFAEAGEEKFGSRRTADQFAMMLTGLYGLQNDRKLQDHEDAKEFILRLDWEGRLKEGPVPSEITLLDTILQTEVLLQFGNMRKMLGELIADEVSCNGKFIERDVLRRHGIMVVEDTLHIANNCVGLKKILKDTPWANKWNQTLINTKSAKKSKGGEFFAAGIQSRSIIIPMPESLRSGDLNESAAFQSELR